MKEQDKQRLKEGKQDWLFLKVFLVAIGLFIAVVGFIIGFSISR